ncbi:MAG: Hpt domain-containing protein [Bacteroidales bacterium]|nr:Hpt domain-containing protein [Bacteroidales bacterium]
MRTNLDYLRTMSGDSKELIVELIEIFKEQVIEFSANMQDFLDNKNFDALGKLAHKANSTVSIMGMKELSVKLKELEANTKKLKNIEEYQNSVDFFKTESHEAIKELNQYINKINPN